MSTSPIICVAFAFALAFSAQAEEISVLSYNTHGLASWIAGDDPESRLPEIGERANGYDVALIQEDFAHHTRLRMGTRHATVRRGKASLKSWCPICSGSGLTFLARWQPIAAVVDGSYGRCSGWLGGANDCLADKGYQIARVRLPGGALVTFANTHLDAGNGDGDRETRRHQLVELREAIRREVPSGALIVGGDFNLDASDGRDVALLRDFARNLGLDDTGARARPGSAWLALDYLLFRSGRRVALEVIEAGEDEDFAVDGKPLSDHPAIFARFRLGARAEPNASSKSLHPPEGPHR